MASTMSSASSDLPIKDRDRDRDRKRSAHWSDEDTDILVNVLLRYKDSGRTADNGFKPEVWQEASGLLEGTTYMGGPKTADACKSRWQRLQRDYKAVKDMESMPGFTWDRSTHRLSASTEAWEAAEKQVDAYKYRKIHLPCFDSLAILCVLDSTRGRIKQKSRTSLASASDTSSMLSISVGSGGPGPQAMANGRGPMQHHHSHSIGSMNDLSLHQHQHAQPHSFSAPGPGQHTGQASMHHQHPSINANIGQNAHALAHLQGQLTGDHGVFTWGESGEEDGEGEFDGSFTIPDNPQPFVLGKRQLPFDPSLLAGPTQPHALPLPQGSPPKKARMSTATSSGISVRPQPLPHQTGTGSANHSHQHAHTHTHSHPQLAPQHVQSFTFQLAPSSNTASTSAPTGATNTSATSLSHGQMGIPRSPDFGSSTTTNTLLESHVLQTPPPGMMKPFTPSSTPGANAGVSSGFPFPNGPLSAEVTAAGLSDAQRRTEAILQLQNRESDFSDEDLVEVMAEFESSVAAADTYLAIKKDALRKLWLTNVVKRRKQ